MAGELILEPVPGRVYRIHSRNLQVAACVGPRAFVGIREKLGSRYLFTEFGGDGGGSVRSIREDLGPVPEGIPLRDHLPPYCSACGRPTKFVVTQEDGRGEHVHEDGTPLEDGAESLLGTNRELFTFLESLEVRLAEGKG